MTARGRDSRRTGRVGEAVCGGLAVLAALLLAGCSAPTPEAADAGEGVAESAVERATANAADGAASVDDGTNAVAEDTGNPPTPLLWKVSDADNDIYLLGSFHLLKPGDYPLAASTDAAFADAEQLVFELAPQDLTGPALAQAMAQAARRDDGRTLQQALPPATWTVLQNYLQRRRMDPVAMQQYDTWFVSLLVAMTEMQAAGLAADHGLDRHFADRAVAAGKPARGLETIDQQIALFEGMTPEQQVQSLAATLEDAADMQSVVAQLHDLWRAGDADGLFAVTGAEMKAEFPALYNRMNRDRNRAWLPELRHLLDGSDGDDTLVVVGAMHLLGEDGVVEGLRAAGYTVERLGPL